MSSNHWILHVPTCFFTHPSSNHPPSQPDLTQPIHNHPRRVQAFLAQFAHPNTTHLANLPLNLACLLDLSLSLCLSLYLPLSSISALMHDSVPSLFICHRRRQRPPAAVAETMLRDHTATLSPCHLVICNDDWVEDGGGDGDDDHEMMAMRIMR